MNQLKGVFMYNKIIEGIFLERTNRFIAKVLINEKVELVHVKNTGRCVELFVKGTKIIIFFILFIEGST